MYLRGVGNVYTMAHHYAGGHPDEAVPEITVSETLKAEEITVPGSDSEYSLSFDVNMEELVHQGTLIDAEIASGLSTFKEVMENYDEDTETLEVFLGYVENDWTAEEMWHQTDMGRDSIYSATEILEEDYELLETDFGDVEVTESGQNFYDTFVYLSGQT